jgi:predicted enzyme related to lactoylglutathione lyase
MIDACITFLPTADLEATSAFYEGLLGLPLARDQGDCRIYRAAADAYIGFCLRPLPGRPADRESGVIITLVASESEVDRVHDVLVRGGTTVIRAPSRNPRYGIYNAFYLDPNGCRVEIQAFDDPL